jgi:hypothetical protein
MDPWGLAVEGRALRKFSMHELHRGCTTVSASAEWALSIVMRKCARGSPRGKNSKTISTVAVIVVIENRVSKTWGSLWVDIILWRNVQFPAIPISGRLRWRLFLKSLDLHLLNNVNYRSPSFVFLSVYYLHLLKASRSLLKLYALQTVIRFLEPPHSRDMKHRNALTPN